MHWYINEMIFVFLVTSSTTWSYFYTTELLQLKSKIFYLVNFTSRAVLRKDLHYYISYIRQIRWMECQLIQNMDYSPMIQHYGLRVTPRLVSHPQLQQAIDAFESWCKSWKLQVQPTKTELIHFSYQPRKQYKHPVTANLDNTSIKPLESTRYLGVIIDKQLQWRSHLDNIERKIAPRMGLLRYLSRDQHMTLITRRW